MSDTKALTVTTAIRKVLGEADGPLRASEIGEKVVPLVPGLKGKTPKATVAAKLYTEAKKPDGLVEKVEGGFVLRAQAASPIKGAETIKEGDAKPDAKRGGTVAGGEVKPGTVAGGSVKPDPKPGRKKAA